MKRIMLLVALLVGAGWLAGPVHADGLALSSSLFESVAQAHWKEARDCWRGSARRIPSAWYRRHLIAGIWSAAGRWYPDDPEAPYRMFALALTESNGNPVKVERPGEKSYGPFCATVEEARDTSRIYRLECPRSRQAVVDRLMEDPEWAAAIAAGTLWRCDMRQGLDEVRGLLAYKMGDHRLADVERTLAREIPPRTITACSTWDHYESITIWLRCLRDRLGADGRVTPYPCACMPSGAP